RQVSRPAFIASCTCAMVVSTTSKGDYAFWTGGTMARSISIFVIFLLGYVSASAQVWDRNLIVNPGAEDGPGIAKTSETISNVPGWTRTGAFTVGQYVGGMPIGKSNFVPEDHGKNYFLGGANGVTSSATQTIDVSAGATEIDAGRIRFYLGGLLRSYDTYAIPKLRASFLDAQGGKLLELEVSGPRLDDGSGLEPRSGSGFVLPNTRKIAILLDLAGPSLRSGQYNNSGADNLYLVLRIEPIFGANLVVNGDAELPPNVGGQAKMMPGWNGEDQFRVVAYAGDLLAQGMLPTDRGLQFFYSAGSGHHLDSYQRLDVSLAKDRIDAGGVNYAFSAWLGGAGKQPTSMTAKAEFFGEQNHLLGTSQELGPVTLENRGGKPGLQKRSTEGVVPAGTRSILISLVIPDTPGFGEAYADNVAFALNSGGAVTIKDGGIRNAASAVMGPVAPGEMITILMTGVNLSDTTRMQLDSAGRMMTTLGQVRVFFDGTQAPLLYVNSSEIGAIVPFDVAGKSSVAVRVEYKGAPSQTVTIQSAETAPGVFTIEGSPKGPGLILNDNFALNAKDNPAVEGSAVSLYWTGGGQTDPPGVDGRIAMPPLARPIASVSATIGGKPAEVRFSGAVPYGWTGLLMAEVVVPAGIASDDPVPVVITAGAASSPESAVTMYVKQP
ncbi:MAG: hypothetical protein C5B51_21700, partial [Terriglobia bacterium]